MDIDALAVAVVGQQLSKNRDVTLAADHKNSLSWLCVALHEGIHPKVAVPPAGGCICTDEILVLSNVIGHYVEGTILRIEIGIICTYQQFPQR